MYCLWERILARNSSDVKERAILFLQEKRSGSRSTENCLQRPVQPDKLIRCSLLSFFLPVFHFLFYFRPVSCLVAGPHEKDILSIFVERDGNAVAWGQKAFLYEWRWRLISESHRLHQNQQRGKATWFVVSGSGEGVSHPLESIHPQNRPQIGEGRKIWIKQTVKNERG